MLLRLRDVSVLAPIFSDMAAASGLGLHREKGVVVPLRDGADDRVRRRVARARHRSAPEWSAYKLAGNAKYLGFRIGPRAGEAQWEGALIRWRQRCRDIGCEGLPVQAAASAYRTRAPAHGVGRRGVRSRHGAYGKRTLAGWEVAVDRVRIATEEHGTLASWAQEEWALAGWDSRPMARLLAAAVRGAGLPVPVSLWLAGAAGVERRGSGIQRALTQKLEVEMTPQVVVALAAQRIARWGPDEAGLPPGARSCSRLLVR